MKNADPLWTLVVDSDPGSLVALYTNRKRSIDALSSDLPVCGQDSSTRANSLMDV
jgi:hypothetical protein